MSTINEETLQTRQKEEEEETRTLTNQEKKEKELFLMFVRVLMKRVLFVLL